MPVEPSVSEHSSRSVLRASTNRPYKYVEGQLLVGIGPSPGVAAEARPVVAQTPSMA
jgi:hypothetical protein